MRSNRETNNFHRLSTVARRQHRAPRTRSSSHLQHGVLQHQLRRDLQGTIIRIGPNRGFIAAARDGVFRVFARNGGSRLYRAGRLRHRGVGQLPPRHGRAGRLIVHGTTEVPPFIIVIIRRHGVLGDASGTCRGKLKLQLARNKKAKRSKTSGHSSAASHVHLPPDAPAPQPQLTAPIVQNNDVEQDRPAELPISEDPWWFRMWTPKDARDPDRRDAEPRPRDFPPRDGHHTPEYPGLDLPPRGQPVRPQAVTQPPVDIGAGVGSLYSPNSNASREIQAMRDCITHRGAAHGYASFAQGLGVSGTQRSPGGQQPHRPGHPAAFPRPEGKN